MLGFVSLLFLMSAQGRRDATVAAVGFTSWAAVAWKLSRLHSGTSGAEAADAVLALAAALLCLWPIVLGLAPAPVYARWREWLVPAHLAIQHWIGLRFALPPEAQQLLSTPGWARGMLPIFLATFCQPWLYLAFGACLQRTRLRTFLWTQPLLLAPMLWMGRAHCSAQLAATPEAGKHLLQIARIMQHCSSWLPVGPLPAAGNSTGLRSGAAAMAAAAVAPQGAASGFSACLAVHFWLVLVLAYGMPAIVIHRLEGSEEQARQLARKEQARRRAAGQEQAGQQAAGTNGEPRRDLLLQRPQSLLGSAAELVLAGYTAWLLVQLVLPLLG